MSKKTKELEKDVEVKVVDVKETREEVKTYSQEQLVKSQKFKGLSDIVRSVIGEKEKVTIVEVEKRIESFLIMEVR